MHFLRMIFAPIPILFFILSSIILCYYSLDSKQLPNKLDHNEQQYEEKITLKSIET
jgi:Na+/melibiose symporter-like transporter